MTVLNAGPGTATGVGVNATFRIYDVSNTRVGFDAGEFGGPADIPDGQSVTFDARAVTVDAGVSVTYTATAAIDGIVLAAVPETAVDGVPIITCEPD